MPLNPDCRSTPLGKPGLSHPELLLDWGQVGGGPELLHNRDNCSPAHGSRSRGRWEAWAVGTIGNQKGSQGLSAGPGPYLPPLA